MCLGNRCSYWKGNVTLKRNKRPYGETEKRREEEGTIAVEIQLAWIDATQRTTKTRSILRIFEGKGTSRWGYLKNDIRRSKNDGTY